jgi:transglutaminase-like putative cysteine protease
VTRGTAESLPLAIAFGASLGAFAAAAAALGLPGSLVTAVAASVLAGVLMRIRVEPRPSARVGSIVQWGVLSMGLLAFVSRVARLVAEDGANRIGSLIGGILAACAAWLLWRGRATPVHSGLLPASIGLLVAAGLHTENRRSFVPLACIAGVAFWAWATAAGGPTRRAMPLALFLLTAGGLAGGTIFFLPWAQPYVEAFGAGALADGQTGLSNRTALGDVQRLAPSRRLVARVWTSVPSLLRMQVLTDFDGKAWSARSEARELTPDVALDTAIGPLLRSTPGNLFGLIREGRPGIETRVVPSLSWGDGWGLLVPAGPTIFRIPSEKITVEDTAGTIEVAVSPSIYGVSSSAGDAVASSEPATDDPTRKPTADARIQGLATSLGPAAATPRQKVDRTVEYLSRYRYTLEGLPSSLDDFLFEKRAGYCEFFATAAVVLLRHQGVPARYVRGVRVSPESEVGDHYVVRESDAHAWIDAYVAGQGWVEVDPTPAGSARLARPTALAERWEAVESWFIEAWIRLEEEGWPGLRQHVTAALERARDFVARHTAVIVGSVAVVGVVGLGWRLRQVAPRFLRRPRPSDDGVAVPSELRTRIREMERRWAREDWPRPPSVGLRAHSDGLPAEARRPEERQADARLVEAYYAVRFGGATLTDEELSRLRADPSELGG